VEFDYKAEKETSVE